MLRRLAGTALTTAAAFLMVVAIMIDSPALFYMGTAMTVMLLVCRLQAWMGIRWLRFERVASATVTAGELVTMEISCWSEHRVKRPLILIRDRLPKAMVVKDLTPSLPIAPAYDIPIVTQYQFRPTKRGKYNWSGIEVVGFDALGLVRLTKNYNTGSAQLIVWPRPIPIHLDLATATGWGISENESGNSRGAGIEPRGLREYAAGDSIRRIHWPSSARTGNLMVKEFEAGSNIAVAFAIQHTVRTEIGVGANTTLELMCAHCSYLSDLFLSAGAAVNFPGLDPKQSRSGHQDRMEEIKDMLAGLTASSPVQLGESIAEQTVAMPPGSTLYALLSVADPTLPNAALALRSQGTQMVAILYDAAKFLPKGRDLKVRSAVAPDYLLQLEAAGIQTMIVPTDSY